MKKTLVSALTTALVVGAASTTFAAANPFSDVPADHWAYDAVSQLAADGVIEGYGDTTFRGNQNITRYEMAQMIAKAMAKSDVSAADKALIDKLAAEFSDELSNLGVRVANLERNADKVKWNGLVEYTYTSTRHDTQSNATKSKVNDDDLVFRLEPKAEVNKNWDVHARLDADMKLDKDQGSDGKVDLKRVWAEGHYDNFNVKLGKLPNAINLLSTTDDPYSGAAVTFGKDLKVTLEAGRIDAGSDFGDVGRKTSGLLPGSDEHVFKTTDDTVNFQGINFGYAKSKFYGNAGYEHMDGATFNPGYTLAKAYKNSDKAGQDNEFKANIWFVNAGYRFDHNNFFKAEYAQNTEADNYDNAYSFEYDYKGAQPENPGTWGMYLAYRNLGQYAAPWSTYGDGVDGGQKGIEVGTTYTAFRNIQFIAKYFNGKDIAADKDASKLFGRIDVFF
ncbi:S-layer homology domain-containing protein [Mitsuokella sp.]|uniref:S-layer homology domain-containing protein n=1 Tax=uncultured Mitsuokella sp. TaxID=453120 RepID=UPI0025DD5B2C|nr:S-layer homology domain-containing protein [uncultured Mitsuokella sp.]